MMHPPLPNTALRRFRAGRISRALLSILLVVAVAMTGAARHFAQQAHDRLDPPPAGVRDRIAEFDSFSLALVLGGLRGPLVMYLWTSSESQKTEHDLEDVNTKIELIRLLQPEFDSVTIFQSWNLAYNISVQLASNSAKYLMILEGINYCKKVDAQRPDDVSILYMIGSLYDDKLGRSAEHRYFIEQVRQDTLPHGARGAAAAGRPSWLNAGHEQLVDEQGVLLPKFTQPDAKHAKPADLAEGADWNNGAELQYLGKYSAKGGFPQGVPPQALGYNYYKRAQVLLQTLHLHHLQLSDYVVDSRPSSGLESWLSEEWERARRLEAELYDVSQPYESRVEIETLAANSVVPPPHASPDRLEDILFCCRRAALLCDDASAELAHIRNVYPDRAYSAGSRLLFLSMAKSLLSADGQCVDAMRHPAATRAQLLATAKEGYRASIDKALLLILKYCVDDDAARNVFPSASRTYITAGHAGRVRYDNFLPGRNIVEVADPKGNRMFVTIGSSPAQRAAVSVLDASGNVLETHTLEADTVVQAPNGQDISFGASLAVHSTRVTSDTIEKLDHAQYPGVLRDVLAYYAQRDANARMQGAAGYGDQHQADREEYQTYIDRAEKRIDAINALKP